MVKDYTIGLDIGTTSVGWSVTSNDAKLIKKKMNVSGNTSTQSKRKNFWGVRKFKEAETAEGRRLKRSTRRSNRRKRNRILYLQDIFRDEIEPKDPNFFTRLTESSLIKADKTGANSILFNTQEEEKEYHSTYPTIYHLREHLANSTEKEDVRLIYLALAHIMKNRGHFLIEGTLDTQNINSNELYEELIEAYNEAFNEKISETVDLEEILKQSMSQFKKAKELNEHFPDSNDGLKQLNRLILANKANFKKAFDSQEDLKLDFTVESYEDDLNDILAEIGEEYAPVFEIAKELYESIQLKKIINEVPANSTNAIFSASMVKRYEKHAQDLALLKKVVTTYLPNKYADFFKNTNKNGYAAYIDGVPSQTAKRKISLEDFYKFILKELKVIEDKEEVQQIFNDIEKENFLRKQRDLSNAIVPNQLHLKEFNSIINNQAQFYPFIKENASDLERIVTFYIPYYIGPLTKGDSEFGWNVRNSDEKVTPLNIEEVINYPESAIKFIERMSRNDQYLPTEKALPKNSMIYQEHAIYNELTGVKYTNERGEECNLCSEEKLFIFEHLFKEVKNVSRGLLVKTLKEEFEIEIASITGIDSKFRTSYSTYHDFLKMGVSKELLDEPSNSFYFEDIIKKMSIFNDRKMLAQQIEEYSYLFDENTFKKLTRKFYSGWGKYSQKLLIGIRDNETNKTIMDFLINDDGYKKNNNRTVNQLVSDNSLSFKDDIREAKADTQGKTVNEKIQGIATSPSIKRGINQGVRLVQEISEIMGYAPTNIVFSLHEEHENNIKRQVKNKYSKIQKGLYTLNSTLLKDEPIKMLELADEKLYLYYIQNGKDLYTGERINRDELDKYSVDYIISKDFLNDDSYQNKALVKDASIKENELLPRKTVMKLESYWKELFDAKLISKQCYTSLTLVTKGGLNDSYKAHFIEKQLAEKFQLNKNIAYVLDTIFNEDGKHTKIIPMKSSFISQIRAALNTPENREVNDYCFGHNAYLSAVVATQIIKEMPELKNNLIYNRHEEINNFETNKRVAAELFYSNILISPSKGDVKRTIWTSEFLFTIYKMLNISQMNITFKAEEGKGQFYNETIVSKENAKNAFPIKNNKKDTSVYGGYISAEVAYLIFIRNEKEVLKVPVLIIEKSEYEKDPKDFLEKRGYSNYEIVAKALKYITIETPQNEKRLITGSNEIQKNNQFAISVEENKIIYYAKHIDELTPKQKVNLEKNSAVLKDLIVRLIDFSYKYSGKEKIIYLISTLFEQNKQLGIEEKCRNLINVLTFVKAGPTNAMEIYEEKITRQRYSLPKNLKGYTLVFESTTGLREKRIEL